MRHWTVPKNFGMNHGMKSSGEGSKKVTISLRPRELEIMARFAKQRHRGNLSGAFAELIEHAARLEAMDHVLAGLPKASARGLARLEEELLAPLGARAISSKKKRAA
jgi:hypothetical protein